MLLGAGQILYVMSESKKLTQTASILNLLKEWQSAGNTLPLPTMSMTRKSRLNATRAHSALVPQQPHNHETINLRFARRSEADVIVEDASSVMTGGEEICNHIIVVSDLDHVSIEAFVRMLRLERHVKGSEDYHPIIFLSWSTKSPVIAA
jgi:hypothetical protein